MEYASSCIYDAFDHLEKIKVLGHVKIVSSNEGPAEINNDYKKKIHYTCLKKKCLHVPARSAVKEKVNVKNIRLVTSASSL